MVLVLSLTLEKLADYFSTHARTNTNTRSQGVAQSTLRAVKRAIREGKATSSDSGGDLSAVSSKAAAAAAWLLTPSHPVKGRNIYFE